VQNARHTVKVPAFPDLSHKKGMNAAPPPAIPPFTANLPLKMKIPAYPSTGLPRTLIPARSLELNPAKNRPNSLLNLVVKVTLYPRVLLDR
jgi:hypothetical protein